MSRTERTSLPDMTSSKKAADSPLPSVPVLVEEVPAASLVELTDECLLACWSQFSKGGSSTEEGKPELPPMRLKLTKGFAISVYLGLQRLMGDTKLGLMKGDARCKKRKRHGKWKDAMKDVLVGTLRVLTDTTTVDASESECADNGQVYEDIRRVQIASLKMDTATRKEFLNEEYRIGSVDNSQMESEASKAVCARFSERQRRESLVTDEDPFAKLHFSVDLALLTSQPRYRCTCRRMVHLYCAHCQKSGSSLPLVSGHKRPLSELADRCAVDWYARGALAVSVTKEETDGG